MSASSERPIDPLLEELRENPRGEALARLVHALAMTAFDEKRPALDQGLQEAATRLEVEEAQADTSFGNVVRALGKSTTATGPERRLLGVLLAKGVALSPVEGGKSEDRVASALTWIGANTSADALPFLDAVLAPERAEALWRATGKLLREMEEGTGSMTRAAEIVAAAAIASSPSAAANEEKLALRGLVRDPLVERLLAERGAAQNLDPVVAKAEVMARTWSSPMLFLLTITLILPIVAVLKLIGRFALQLKRPAELRVSATGIIVESRIELLGKTLRETRQQIPLDGLTRAAREVRYPKLATYLGIGTLLIGSYIGLRLVIDGVRAGAPEFLGLGTVVLLFSLGIDYALARLPARTRGKCEVTFQARRGRAIGLTSIDPELADRALLLLRSASMAKKPE